MNALTSPSLEQLHFARSAFIDAFVTVETAVINRLKASDAKLAGLFGQNLDLLRKIPASPRYSKAERASVHAALEELAEVQAVRCDVVHGRLNPVRIDGELRACLINPQRQTERCPLVRLISLAEFGLMTVRLLAIAQKLGEARPNPPSSPPPPSPASATDP